MLFGVALNSAGIARWKQIICLAALIGIPSGYASAGCGDKSRGASQFEIVYFNHAAILEDDATTSANASIGDLNGDGKLDIILIKGRHWPVTNQVLLGDGSGNFNIRLNLDDVADRSYTGALADLDLDGDLDIVVSNDRPDPKVVYLNDGDGSFTIGSTYGQADWGTRNISLVDVNHDKLPDVVVANRGPLEGPSPNYICLNLGEGKFEVDCRQLSDESATTITPFDLNGDSLQDFVVPSRDGAQSHVYFGKSRDGREFEAVPFGPPNASIRATAVADFDCDGSMDIVAIHTGSSGGGDGAIDTGRGQQGTTIYYGIADGGFSAGVVVGDASEMPYALAVEDLNRDGAMDVIVGHVEASSTVLLNDRTDYRFRPLQLGDDEGTTYGFAIADLNEDGQLDIVVAKSGARNRVFFGSRTPKK